MHRTESQSPCTYCKRVRCLPIAVAFVLKSKWFYLDQGLKKQSSLQSTSQEELLPIFWLVGSLWYLLQDSESLSRLVEGFTLFRAPSHPRYVKLLVQFCTTHMMITLDGLSSCRKRLPDDFLMHLEGCFLNRAIFCGIATQGKNLSQSLTSATGVFSFARAQSESRTTLDPEVKEYSCE